MKKPLFTLIILLASCQTMGPPPTPPLSAFYPRPNGTALGMMTLNLHTWQEENPFDKLDKIATTIAYANLDVVTLQEVGQHEEASPMAPENFQSFAPFQNPDEPLYQTLPKAPGNAAMIILEKLKKDYSQDWQMVWTWSHMGFGVYQEGLAILTRHKITASGNKYVSAAVTPEEISSRKVLWADIEIPGLTPIRVFSAHLGWGGDQIPQIQNFKKYTMDLPPRPTFIGGDFNLGPDEPGYQALVKENSWRDDYFAVNPDGFDDITCGKRIDYLLTPEESEFFPGRAQRYFREEDELGPRVSDHSAVIVWYKFMKGKE